MTRNQLISAYGTTINQLAHSAQYKYANYRSNQLCTDPYPTAACLGAKRLPRHDTIVQP